MLSRRWLTYKYGWKLRFTCDTRDRGSEWSPKFGYTVAVGCTVGWAYVEKFWSQNFTLPKTLCACLHGSTPKPTLLVSVLEPTATMAISFRCLKDFRRDLETRISRPKTLIWLSGKTHLRNIGKSLQCRNSRLFVIFRLISAQRFSQPGFNCWTTLIWTHLSLMWPYNLAQADLEVFMLQKSPICARNPLVLAYVVVVFTV